MYETNLDIIIYNIYIQKSKFLNSNLLCIYKIYVKNKTRKFGHERLTKQLFDKPTNFTIDCTTIKKH